MKTLVVAPYPPIRDGIGAYAAQQVRALRRAGHDVEVLSPMPSAAHHHRDLLGPRGALALGRLARGFDRVIIHFHQDVFFPRPSTPESRRSTARALTAAFRIGPPVTLVLHEVIYGWLDDTDDAAPQLKKMFRAAAAIDVHVAEHRDVLVEKAGVRPDRITLVDHGADFVARTTVDQATARRSLGLPAEGHLFLSIGFVAPHKGFDRAIRAFAGLGDQGAELHVVGSVRVDDPIANDHRRQLERLAAETPGVHLHLGFVGDEAFDRWIVAADTVVLPYRHIWSSGVAERAALYDR
ncbi:MAG TPA: glycosyltransferase family 4 protein, partial [Acidimicrobiales bacterium]